MIILQWQRAQQSIAYIIVIVYRYKHNISHLSIGCGTNNILSRGRYLNKLSRQWYLKWIVQGTVFTINCPGCGTYNHCGHACICFSTTCRMVSRQYGHFNYHKCCCCKRQQPNWLKWTILFLYWNQNSPGITNIMNAPL